MSDIGLNWQEVVIELKRLTGLSWAKLAFDIGVNQWVIEDMAKGNVQDPRFSNGFAVICYAGEVGAKLKRAKNYG